MKNTIAVAAVLSVLFACQGNHTDYKTVRDEVMEFHDVVMADHGSIVKNQMKLDTLLKDMAALKKADPALDTLTARQQMLSLKAELLKAEDGMNDWMHKFEPDVTGKSNAESVAYFEAEKRKIVKIDSIYKKEIAMSSSYLTQFSKR